jgi:hypothetical protein
MNFMQGMPSSMAGAFNQGKDFYNQNKGAINQGINTASNIYNAGAGAVNNMRSQFAGGGMAGLSGNAQGMLNQGYNQAQRFYNQNKGAINQGVNTASNIYNRANNFFRNAFEDGGSVPEEDDEFELVHLNEPELNSLLELQGGEDMEMSSEGYHILRRLGQLLRNPETRALLESQEDMEDEEMSELERLQEEADAENQNSKAMRKKLSLDSNADREEYKKGGNIHHKGMMGDTKCAYVPKHVTKIWDKAIGGVSRNPKTGKKQYFLGSFLSKLGKGFNTAITGTGNYLNNLMKPIGRGLTAAGQGAADLVGGGLQQIGNTASGVFGGGMGGMPMGEMPMGGRIMGGMDPYGVMGGIGGMMPQAPDLAGMGRSALQSGLQGFGQAMADPNFQMTPQGFGQAASRGLGAAGQSAYGSAQGYVDQMPGFAGEVARGAFGGATQGGSGGGFNMDTARRVGQGALGGAIRSAQLGMSQRLPGAIDYLSQAAGRYATPAATRAFLAMGANPEEAGVFGDQMGGMAENFARSSGRFAGNRLEDAMSGVYNRYGGGY